MVQKGGGMQKNKGFTLVEIMVVIAIIITLAGLLMPALNRARRQAKRVECINNLRQIGIALNSYALDNDGKFPDTLQALVDNKYLSDSKMLYCPERKNEIAQYRYKSPGTVSNVEAGTPLVECDSDNHLLPNPYNVLYGDGHVRSEPSSKVGHQ